MRGMKKVISSIKGIDERIMRKAQTRLDSLTKPPGSLGRLEELARVIAGITGKAMPRLNEKVIFTLAADHGVCAENISAFPSDVTVQMVGNFLKGGAGINVLAGHIGARVVVADLGVKSDFAPRFSKKLKRKKVNFGTRNFILGPAMSRGEAVRSVQNGIDIFEEELDRGIDIIGTGEMGIGNTTASSAIAACITRTDPSETAGRGTGLGDKALQHKITVIRKALEVNRPDPGDALDVLSKVGGFEIGGLAGIMLAAASRKVPVVLDGFISGAAALIAVGLQPKVKEYMIASHCSVERGHKVILEYLGIDPVLNLDLRLGEGTGAALGIFIAEAATKILTGMATFQQARVSERKSP
ncbi:MAG: nicotinate-nucleotide--dimethylbenzimidazole phosphoribosyltransferase [Candidatus Omnitrophica bacterium]|nr:nicotinate-nucleotide--dimethylbenzimidazole phosphoribosyltransferase [Candidatus Omnitrophota bacterium]